jgi:hypothetical protein
MVRPVPHAFAAIGCAVIESRILNGATALRGGIHYD